MMTLMMCLMTMAVSAEVLTPNFYFIPTQGSATPATGTQIDATVDGISFSFRGFVVLMSWGEWNISNVLRVVGRKITISSETQIDKIEVIGLARKGVVIKASTGTMVGGNYNNYNVLQRRMDPSDYVHKYEYEEPLFVINNVNAKSVVITSGEIILCGVRITTTDDTAIKNITIDNSVYAVNGTVYAEGEFQIFSVAGQNVTELNGQLNGIYVVKTAKGIQKVAVK